MNVSEVWIIYVQEENNIDGDGGSSVVIITMVKMVVISICKKAYVT